MNTAKLCLFVGLSLVGLRAFAAPGRPVNVLFLLVDQMRWDAMSSAGNSVIKTPNLDKLAEGGARFTSFYSSCPVCVPARTVILTGHNIEANQVLSNGDLNTKDHPAFPSFDQVLIRAGYKGEYQGKFHSPYKLAMDYSTPVRWLNGPKPAGSQATESQANAFKEFVAANVPMRPLKPGELVQTIGIYHPIPLDASYGKEVIGNVRPIQQEAYGRAEAPAEFTLASFTGKEGLQALDRLKDEVFTLTISFDPPHPPMIIPDPYFSLYPYNKIPVPVSINDSMENSPYAGHGKGALDPRYRDPVNIQQMRSIYYGMITQVDDWVGEILKRLDAHGLADNTLVVFTADHGEMLGDHGLHGKGFFYEGSVHVPFIIRLPGVISPRTVVTAPASQVDIFATILDYCGQPIPANAGQSLRPLIDGTDHGAGRFAVSEWNDTAVPGFMLFDGRWKLMYGRTAAAPSVDALYDLKTDPEEMNNLIGKSPDQDKFRPEVARLKGLLVDWLTAVGSPSLGEVKDRPLLGNRYTSVSAGPN